MKNKLLIIIVMMSAMPLFAAAPAAKKQKGEFGQAVAPVSKEEFIQAIKDGNKNTVTQYLMNNDDINWRDEENLTPLMHAAMGKSLPIFTAILAKTKHVDEKDTTEKTALLWATSNSSPQALYFVKNLMAKGARLDSVDNGGANAFRLAIMARNRALVEYLLTTKKFQVDFTNNLGRTFLFYAMGSILLSTDEQQKQAAFTIAELLLKHRANIEHRDSLGISPLLYVISFRNPSSEAVTFLLDHGADINGQRILVPGNPHIFAFNPLLMAINGRSRLDAPVDATPQAQARAKELTQEKNNTLMNIIRILVDRGADVGLVTIRPGNIISPLINAAYLGDFQVVKYLVESGVDIAIKGQNRLTALDLAKSQLADEVNPAKKSQYQLIVDYLSNPLTHTRRVMVCDAIKEGQATQGQASSSAAASSSSAAAASSSSAAAAASSSSIPAAAASSSSAAVHPAVAKQAEYPALTQEQKNFMQAIKDGKENDVSRYLNDHPDVNWQDKEGITPFLYAIQSIFFSANEQQKQAAFTIAELLLKHGANIERRDLYGHSALLNVIFTRNPMSEIVIFLLDHGADINGQRGLVPGSPNLSLHTPLLRAIFERSRLDAPVDATPQAQVRAKELTQERNNTLMNIIRILVDRGADLGLVTFMPGKLISPLMYAAHFGDFQVVKYLVESGIDIAIKDNKGFTALDYARSKLGVEVNPAKKSQYQLIVDYLSNPLTHTRSVLAQRQLEETYNMPTVLSTIVGEYLTGPKEDKRIINEIKTALAKKDLSRLAQLLDQNPNAVGIADEGENTPLVLAVGDNYEAAIPSIIQHLNNYRDKQLKDFYTQLNDIAKQEREAHESLRHHEKILDALKLQISTARDEKEKDEIQKALNTELAQDTEKREAYEKKMRELSFEQRRIKLEVSDVSTAYDAELGKAKEFAKRLGYQGVLKLLQAYSPSQELSSSAQQATASSSSAAAASSSSSSGVVPMELN